MKLVLVTQNLAPFRLQWMRELSKYLDIKIYHLNEYDSSVNPKYLRLDTTGISVDANYRRFCGRRFFRIHRILSERADFLLLDGYGFPAQVLLIIALRLLRFPFYLTVDGGLSSKTQNPIRNRLKSLCLNSPKAIFSTSAITDNFLRQYLHKPVPLIRHYLSTVHLSDIHRPSEEEKQSLRQKLNLSHRFTVLTVGRFLPVKGFDILLRTANICPEIDFIFIGGEPPQEYTSLLSPDTNHVRFLDFMDQASLREYYDACDVFVFPSRGDVWGLVVGEAMSRGLPIVSSKNCVAAASMIVDGENGYIAEQNTPENYAAILQSLCVNPDLVSFMGVNNAVLMERYSLENSAVEDFRNICRLVHSKHKKEG